MSLESTIGDLVTKTTLLLDYFGGKKAGIDAAVAAAIAAVPVNKKVFYVHQLNGVDTNDGSYAAPLKTIEKAIAMTPVGGVLSVRLLADYVPNTTISLEGVRLEIRTDTIGTKRFLRPAYYKSADGLSTVLAGFSMVLGGELSYRDTNIELPSITGQDPLPIAGNNSFMKANATSSVTMLAVKMIDCVISDVPGATACLLASSNSPIIFGVTGTTFPAGFAGRYIVGVAGGTASNTLSNIVTNLATL